MLLTIGKAGGIISKLSHKKQGQNALKRVSHKGSSQLRWVPPCGRYAP